MVMQVPFLFQQLSFGDAHTLRVSWRTLDGAMTEVEGTWQELLVV
jgi:hypothetical protein